MTKLYPDKLEFQESVSEGFIVMDIYVSTEPLETRVLTLKQAREAKDRLSFLIERIDQQKKSKRKGKS